METLVLDQSYLPVARCPWQRAVTLLFLGKVEVVEEYEDQEIRSVTFSIKMPSVVRFVNAIRRKKKVEEEVPPEEEEIEEPVNEEAESVQALTVEDERLLDYAVNNEEPPVAEHTEEA